MSGWGGGGGRVVEEMGGGQKVGEGRGCWRDSVGVKSVKVVVERVGEDEKKKVGGWEEKKRNKKEK